MNTHVHLNMSDQAIKFIHRISPSVLHFIEKIALIFIPLPVFMVFLGIEGIIEKDSPDSLATIASMGSSFFNSLEMHTLVLAGAFGITYIIWIITRKIWVQSDEELEEEAGESEQYYYAESEDETACETENTPQLLTKKTPH